MHVIMLHRSLTKVIHSRDVVVLIDWESEPQSRSLSCLVGESPACLPAPSTPKIQRNHESRSLSLQDCQFTTATAEQLLATPQPHQISKHGIRKGPRQARQGHSCPRSHRYDIPTFEQSRAGRIIGQSTDNLTRLSWWCHSSARRIHGRHYPLYHPQRQGPRYDLQGHRREDWIGNTDNIPQSRRTTFSACSSLSVRPGD